MQETEVRIRVPNEVHEVIKKKAIDEGRSMNKQITQVLKEYAKRQTAKN